MMFNPLNKVNTKRETLARACRKRPSAWGRASTAVSACAKGLMRPACSSDPPALCGQSQSSCKTNSDRPPKQLLAASSAKVLLPPVRKSSEMSAHDDNPATTARPPAPVAPSTSHTASASGSAGPPATATGTSSSTESAATMSLASAVVNGLMARIRQEQVTAAQPLAAVSQASGGPPPATTGTAGAEGEKPFAHPLCGGILLAVLCQWELVGAA